jgi:phosphohistidine phosphatase
MKHLVIVRHAKSSWDHPALDDIDRPLNERGIADAPVMARRLKDRSLYPQQMISSPAVRAITTCLAFANVMGFPHERILREKRIYHADVDQLLDVIRNIEDMQGDQPVFLFGHNPGLTDLVNELLDENIDNVPTTGVVSCTLQIENWAEADVSCGELDFFDYPKKA